MIETKIRFNDKGTSYSNITSIQDCLKAINELIGDKDIRSIDTMVGNEMLSQLTYRDEEKKDIRSVSYLRKVKNNFKRVMDYAREKHYTDEIIGKLILNRDLKTPDKDKKVYDTETLKEIGRVIEKNPRYNALIKLMQYTGMRQEEALALNIDDFLEKDGKYWVYLGKVVAETEKNQYNIVDRLKADEEKRMIVIPKLVYDTIQEYYQMESSNASFQKRKEANGYGRLVFANQNGKPMNKRTLYHAYTGYMRRNFKGWEKGGLHCYRHSYASLMTEGVGVELVSNTLGHADTSITSKAYISNTDKKDDMVRDMVEELVLRIEK